MKYHEIALFLSASLLLAAGLSACGPSPSSPETGKQLLELAERGDLSSLDALLKRDANANFRDSCDWTPLMRAAVNGHADVVERLLAAGATVDAKDMGGYTSMMLAASNNHAAIVERLLDAGAMIDAQEQTEGFTALIWATQRGHRETLELLLSRGADASLPDLKGRTALDIANGRSDSVLIDLLGRGK